MVILKSIYRAGRECRAIWCDDKGIITIGHFPVEWGDEKITAYIKGENYIPKENLHKIPDRETENAKHALPPRAQLTETDEKTRRRMLLVAMKSRLNNAGADCSTLKYEPTKDLYISKFGQEEYNLLEQSINGRGA